MAFIPSAETVYSVAYLTDTGRAYLFNENNTRFDTNGDDLFEVTKFTLSDADTNYQSTELLSTGEIPDITGKSEGCLKTTANYIQSNLISFIFDGSPINVEYNTDAPNDKILITETSLPAISGGEIPPTPIVVGPPTSTPSGPTRAA